MQTHVKGQFILVLQCCAHSDLSFATAIYSVKFSSYFAVYMGLLHCPIN